MDDEVGPRRIVVTEEDEDELRPTAFIMQVKIAVSDRFIVAALLLLRPLINRLDIVGF